MIAASPSVAAATGRGVRVGGGRGARGVHARSSVRPNKTARAGPKAARVHPRHPCDLRHGSYSRQQTALIELPRYLRPEGDIQGATAVTAKLSSVLASITIGCAAGGRARGVVEWMLLLYFDGTAFVYR